MIRVSNSASAHEGGFGLAIIMAVIARRIIAPPVIIDWLDRGTLRGRERRYRSSGKICCNAPLIEGVAGVKSKK